ncbi:tRNA (N(6)-L-threonylcarbamoyladenosine(37)-C(2))-methylthiotransferase MtaB [Candidatus Omnitrophota bacterium]
MKDTFYIKTLGCKVNQYESQVIRENFLLNGHSETGNIDEAEVCVVNTCTVTSTSDSKSLRLIRNALKRKDRCVVATGCMVEDKDLDLSRLKGVKFIIKNKDKYRIPYIIKGAPVKKTTSQGVRQTCGITRFKDHTRVFVKIQDGCSNFCSYCKVRLARGDSRSRLAKEILDECRRLIRNGSKEIVLTGICLGAYGRDLTERSDLSRLIAKICEIDGEWRLRLSSIEPKDINEDLIYQFQTQEKLCKHIHIPFQSGDDYILKRMERPYTRKEYLSTVYRLKAAIQDIAISTDIMVGFPGEREEGFQNTVDFIKKVKPMRMHVFPFSRRKGTKAYSYRDEINSDTKKQRSDRLLHIAGELSGQFVDKFMGRKVQVLVEDKRSRDGYLQGYTDRYIRLYIDGPDDYKGQLLKGKILQDDVNVFFLEKTGLP